MLKKFLIASAAGLLLAACQQQQAASPPPAAPPAQGYSVYFDTGQSALSADATATVAQAAASYKQDGRAVAVRGHADTVGNSEFNLQLSQRRAASVKAALQTNGVPATAILSGGVGEQNLPVQTAENVPERLNRTVRIFVAKQALMSDADYCQALSVLYRRYRPATIDEDAARAMGLCQTNPASAIPVLEDAVSQMKVPLPSRALARS